MRNWWRGFNVHWALTILVVCASVMFTFWNPNSIFGESKALNLLGISVRTFESQETVLQFIGAFVVVLGFLGTLHGREHINRLTVSGIIGALLAMVGLVFQIGQSEPGFALHPGLHAVLLNRNLGIAGHSPNRYAGEADAPLTGGTKNDRSSRNHNSLRRRGFDMGDSGVHSE